MFLGKVTIMQMRIVNYFKKRNGLLFLCALGLCHFGLLNRDSVNGKRFITEKFYQYFLNLKKDDYYNELKDQLTSLYHNINQEINIDYPRSYVEKIQWIKAFEIDSHFSELSDKYKVRKWVAERIGEEYLIPMVGGPWKRGEDIEFDSLPDKYVLKANHGSGMNMIIKDGNSVNRRKIIKRTNAWMDSLFGWNGMEVQYFEIPRRIYAEQYIEQLDGGLLDYKIHCFNGVPKLIQVIGDRDINKHTANEAVYDLDWKRVDLMYHTYKQYDKEISKPAKLEKMLELSTVLSKEFKYVRVDLYLIENNIKFGEMTFTPARGLTKWENKDAENMVGEWIEI